MHLPLLFLFANVTDAQSVIASLPAAQPRAAQPAGT